MLEKLKRNWWVLAMIAPVIVVGYIGYGCGSRSRQSQIAELSTKLATSQQTVEIEKGLYATQSAELGGLKDLISKVGEENVALKRQLDVSQAQVLTLNTIVIKWKRAYEDAVSAVQTQPEPGRDRIDFQGSLGPVGVTGYTLTNPAYAWLSVRQLHPLTLGVAVTKNRDGTWSSYVTSSDPDMDVRVSLAAVDPGVTSPTWRQRIWLDASVDALGGRRAGLGLSYHFDRVSIGLSCSVWEGGDGCGATLGYRLFR